MSAAHNVSRTAFYPFQPLASSIFNEPELPNVVGLVVVVIIGMMTAVYYAAIPKPIPGIPYTSRSRWKPLGDAVDFVKYIKETGEEFRFFSVKSQELQSPIFQVFLGPFRKPVVVVADIQELIDISSRRTKEFDRGGFLTEWVGILFPRGTISMPFHDRFKLQRNTWAATMTQHFLNTVSAPAIHQHTANLVSLWATKAKLVRGRPFEVSDDLKQVTFDIYVFDHPRRR